MYDLGWRVVHTEFEQRMIRNVEQYLEDSAIVVAPIDAALREFPRICDTEDLANDLIFLWKSLVARPRFAPVFAVFAYVRCQLAWELTVDHDQIAPVITAILNSWERRAQLFDGANRLAADIMVHHTQSIVSCMAAENAVQCSCPIDLSIQSDRVAKECAHRIARSDGLLGTKWEDLAERFMRPVLRAHQLTYEGHSQAAAAVLAWIERGREAAPLLRQAIATLQRKERDWTVARDVYAGELRAQRAGLNALLAYVEDPEIPEVNFDDAKVVYIYSFTISDIDGMRACKLAEELLPGALGGGRRFRVAETMLTDVWSGHGRRRSKYSGVSLFLPGLSVTTTGGDVLEHAVEVRLSNLGNHYIKIHRTVSDAKLHDVNQALRRVSTAMGLESVREHGSDRVDRKRLPDYAADIACLVVRALRKGSARADDFAPQSTEFTPEENRLKSVVDVHLHVVLEIRKASIADSDDSDRAARPVRYSARPTRCSDHRCRVFPQLWRNGRSWRSGHRML